MEKPLNDAVKLGTRTYFFNLVQSSAKELFVLDFIGKIKLGEVGIKTVRIPEDRVLLRLADEHLQDPFDAAVVGRYLTSNSGQEVQLVEDALDSPADKTHFGHWRRYFTFLVSNETNILDVVLATLNRECATQATQVVYVNHFDIRVSQLLAHYSAVMADVQQSLASQYSYGKSEIAREVQRMLIGVKLASVLGVAGKETYLLKRGYNDLLKKYCFLDKDNDPKLFLQLKRPQAFPNEILDSYVYLGNGQHVGPR